MRFRAEQVSLWEKKNLLSTVFLHRMLKLYLVDSPKIQSLIKHFSIATINAYIFKNPKQCFPHRKYSLKDLGFV